MKQGDRLRTVEAVIISHKNFGEADRLVTFFSKEMGKIRGLAKGVRKMGSRKAAYLEPFMHSKISLAKGKTFWIITQADAVKQYPALSESLEKTGIASYVMELSDRFTLEEESASELFRLIDHTLQRIASDRDAFTPMLYFELHILDYAGFRPDLTDCVSCGETIIAQDQNFSAAQGGAVCPQCGTSDPRVQKISLDALRYLRHYQRSSYSAIAHLTVPKPLQSEISKLVNAYISSIVERRERT